jgi:hypothetical protein
MLSSMSDLPPFNGIFLALLTDQINYRSIALHQSTDTECAFVLILMSVDVSFTVALSLKMAKHNAVNGRFPGQPHC